MTEPIFNPFSGEDEIIVKDKDGKLKVLRGDEMRHIEESAATVHQISTDVPKFDPYKTIVIKDIKGAPTPPQAPDTNKFLDQAKAVMGSLPVVVGDEALRKRLQTIIATRLRGVRDAIETREIILRSSKIGGMGMSEVDTNKVMSVIELAAAGRPLPKGVSQSVSSVSTVRPTTAPGPVASTNEKGDILKMIQEMPNIEVLPNRNAPRQAAPVASKPVSVQSAPVTPAPAPRPQTAVPQTLPRITTMPTEPKQEHVLFRRKKPKLLGPIDELRELSAVEFRRLDPNPVEAAKKIKEKFSFLEKDSFSKKAEGIAAWRQSYLYRLYIEMGKESMEAKAGIDKITEKHMAANQEYLTVPEFEAIMDLNEQIRF